MHEPLLVTARLASPLAGEPPHLDALLEWLLSPYHRGGVPGYKVDRGLPAPAQGAVPVPVGRRWVEAGGARWYVPLCSSPVLAAPAAETAEHFTKRLAVEHAGGLAPGSRVVVNTTGSDYKSYRLPLRVRAAAAVAWFAVGDRRVVLKLVRRAAALGKKVSQGYGRVASWSVVRAGADLSWFAPSDAGPVLMRPLPAGDWLPAGLLGCRRDFGACVPPYWHPDRYAEVVVPC